MTRFIRFTSDEKLPSTTRDPHPEIRYGVVEGGAVFETAGPFREDRTGASFGLTKVRLLPPCSPTKIVCVGKNYADHAKEMGSEPPSEPIIFLKPPSSLRAHQETIIYPKISQLVSFEAELGVVIGKRAKHVAEADAAGVVFGYTCVNDVTARDLQRKDGQWTRGKGFDTFCPVGPWIVGRDDVEFGALRVKCFVNGETKQDAPVTDMLFSVPRVIAYVTEFLTLEPGDIIATGTPPGVGPIQVGDEVQVLIEGVGTLENTVAAG